MSNPFYIPRQEEPKRNDLATILAALKLGIDAYGTWQQGDIAEKKLEAETATATQEQAWKERTHADTMASHEADRAQRAAAANAGLPYHQQSYGYGDHMKLTLKAKDVGDDPNILNFSKQLAADKTITKLDAWKMFREKDELRQSAIESLTKKVQSATEKAAKEGVNYLDTKEGQADYQRLQALSDPDIWKQIVDANFSETATSYNNAQAKAKKEASFAPVNVDGRLVDPNTKQVIYEAPAKPKDNIVTAGRGIFQIGPDGKPKLVATAPQAESTAPTWRTFEKDGVTYQESSRGELKTVDKGTKVTSAEKRQTDKMIADAEGLILNKKNDPEALAGQIDIFNQYANKPYVYVPKDNSRYVGGMKVWSSNDVERIQIPRTKSGKVVNAKDLYEYAVSTGQAYSDVIKQLMPRK
jgi:hypothetical protein